MLRRAAILKRFCDRRRAQNAQKMKCNIMHHQNRLSGVFLISEYFKIPCFLGKASFFRRKKGKKCIKKDKNA